MTAEKLRIMHVHTFYDSYVQAFYKKHHELRGATHVACVSALFRDGFSAVHLPAMYLPQCECRLIISNDPVSQGAWAREHDIAPCEDWEKTILRAQIQEIDPDVLYLVNPLRYDAGFLRSLPRMPRLVMGWRAADVPLGTDWTGYDVMLSALPRMLALATTLGARASELYYPGMPQWIAREVEPVCKDTDVVFAGSVSPTQHARRFQLLHRLAESALEKGFSLALHLACDAEDLSPVMRRFWRPPVFGLDMHKALARGRIVIDCQGNIGVTAPDGRRLMDLAAGDTANMRLWEATAGGSLLLTEHLPGLGRIFTEGEEIASYSDDKDCLDQITYYLSHEDERCRMAAQGRARCLGQWNMKRRAAAYHDIVKRHLAGKES